jgi:tRNA G18 (ribose-2'-O)-methylase SpoU
MPREPISDLDDPRIAVYRSLKLTNLTRGLPHFVVEGEKLVQRLLASRFATVSILATDRYAAKEEGSLPEDVPVYVVPDDLVHQIVGFPFHRGVLACGARARWPLSEEIVPNSGDRLTLIVCPQISNPENLGSIARIGDVFGVDAILVGPNSPDPFSRRVLRVSMGSVLSLPVLVMNHLEHEVAHLLAEHHIDLWGAVAEPSATLFDALVRPARLAILLGDEDRGVTEDWLRRCQRLVTIPMRSGASSLNVAVAAGILLYHLTRR